MSTHASPRRRIRASATGFAALALLLIGSFQLAGRLHGEPRGGLVVEVDGDDAPVGWDGRPLDHSQAANSIPATFLARSYVAGDLATLALARHVGRARVQVFHAGFGSEGPMHGAPMGTPARVSIDAGRVELRLGSWPSGLYYARVTSRGRTGYAPFVLRPSRLGAQRVAVVLPTNTWQAYNFRDDDGNGVPNTWYADPRVKCIGLARPFLGNGVPPHYNEDRGFHRWLAVTDKHVDVLSDDDLDRIGSGDRLAQLYDLVIFPTHEEYVTAREYDAVERYRDLGGNLAFLSANNLFRRVERHGNQLCLVGRFRDLGRAEARVIGVQYVDWNHDRYRNRPFTVVGARHARWLFRGTGLHDGSQFGIYGIEIDARTAQSPPGTQVLATIADEFGPGESAEMTYYTTPRGAQVFAAGVINFGSSALWPVTSRLLDNLWRRLSRP